MILIVITALLALLWIGTQVYFRKRTLRSKKKRLNARLNQCLDMNRTKNENL